MGNRICLNSNTYHGFPFADAVAGAVAAGIRYIEIAAVPGHTEHARADMDPTELRRVSELLEANDLTAIGMCGHSNIQHADGREALVRNMDLAVRLGVEYIVTGTGETHGDVSPVDDHELAHLMRGLEAEASMRGLTLCFETHGASCTTGVQTKAMLELSGAESLGIAYDTANVIFYGDTLPYDDLAACADRVRAIHLKDHAGVWNNWDFPAVGDGDTDFERVYGILRAADCDAPLSIEVEFTEQGPADVVEVHTAVQRSAAHIRAIIANERAH